MISDKALDLIITRVETCGKSYDTIASESGISKSTMSRLVAKRQATMLTLDILAAYFEIGEEWASIVGEQSRSTCHLAADIRSELKQIEAVYAEREERFRQQNAERVEALNEHLNLIREHHAVQLQEFNRNHERSVEYLKEEIKRLRSELDIANNAALSVTSKKHTVFWVLAGVDVVLTVLLFIALKTGPIF